jgi:hypothetical protein
MEKLKKHAKKTQAVPQWSPEMPPYSQEYQLLYTIVSSKAINSKTTTKN